jgi:hypothetical protein
MLSGPALLLCQTESSSPTSGHLLPRPSQVLHRPNHAIYHTHIWHSQNKMQNQQAKVPSTKVKDKKISDMWNLGQAQVTQPHRLSMWYYHRRSKLLGMTAKFLMLHNSYHYSDNDINPLYTLAINQFVSANFHSNYSDCTKIFGLQRNTMCYMR